MQKNLNRFTVTPVIEMANNHRFNERGVDVERTGNNDYNRKMSFAQWTR